MTTAAPPRQLLAGEIARLADPAGRVHPWMIQSLWDRHLIPCQKVGRYRTVCSGDMPKVVQALKAFGYLAPA
jgi:hypothetical protein